ncbi:MBL fold metallo-hydrolase [Streptomyces sp. RFCAC02]|uniref:MBL fold metallo-hydrolase n=1 Tax=Streptomyces sp. RFCAC02 TaxID=2499143 RepID=UPI001020D7F5|nr:MBL fold metallo-hydrolase [Streptomyces sp. RFCAC02]
MSPPPVPTPALSYAVHTAGGPGLHKTSVMVMGERDVLLVDGQFTLAEQHRVVAGLLDSGRRLTTVFVGTPDPDCWLGLEVVRDAFPGARFVAPPGTADRIAAGAERHRAAWRNLGANLAGSVVVPEPLAGSALELEGRVFEVRGGVPSDPELTPRTQYLWQPEDRALIGGAPLSAGLHPWTAAAPSPAARAAWDAVLAEAETLDAAFVVPGHRAPDTATDPSVIAFTRAYLAAFGEEAERARDADALKEAMLRRFPGLDGLLGLDLGARAAVGVPVRTG